MTTTHTPILDPSVRAVIDAGRAMERIIERAAKTKYLATVLVLDEVARAPGITPTPLAAAVGLDRATMSGILNRMVRDRLLERQRDEKDGRTWHLWLTVDGVEQLDDLRDQLVPVNAKLRALLSNALYDTSRIEDALDLLENFTP